MNSYPESETGAPQPTRWAERHFSRRQLGIRLLDRLGWCGLLPAASRASIPEVESDECSNLARYDTLHDVIATVARRQCVVRHLREMNAPEVGVFWFIQRPGFAPELYASSVALQEGKAYGMYIDGPEDQRLCLGSAPADGSLVRRFRAERLAPWSSAFQCSTEAFRGRSCRTVAYTPIQSGGPASLPSA